jgi:hypothetical protein
MRAFPGYTSAEQIGETMHSIVYRARSLSHSEPVVIKALKADNPTPADVARLKHEYELIRSITLEGVVKPLVMEDFGGISL